ncbi:carboxypeptidase regulatory-like domain-containing protein [Humibacter sp.]|uniref:carboxypeptidase regulatory-like domain-containing protein n=1 Tax=Humibacter sp. TaxID=1940291 RepID=UPI003F7D53FB
MLRLVRSITLVAAASIAALVGATLSAADAPLAHADTTGTTYYVDSATGSDANSGTSATSPWQSLTKVDATTFQAGDHILLADGSEWSGATLWPKGSGDSASDITVSDYGSGVLPRIDGAGQVPNAVELFNQQHWTIENIEVTNQAPSTGTPGANLGDFRGIYIGGDDGQTLSGLTVDSVYVHDVTGEVHWMGGSTANNKPGITFGTGWDGMKNTGGIVFETTVADTSNPGNPTILNDMTVSHSRIENTSFGGIITKQYAGTNPGAVATGWGTRSSATDTNYAPFTNLTVENDYITQNGTPYGANGMLLNSVRGALVQNNVVDRVGTCGIEYDYSDDVTTQHNEVMGTSVKAGGGDSNGIDTDMGTTNMIVQDNYLHDNNVGFLDYQIHFGNSIWRYNVVANNSEYPMQLGSASSATAQIYNNTFYNVASSMAWLMTASNYAFTNNAFYSTAASPAMPTGAAITYQNNYYGGAAPTIPAAESHPVTGDDRFTDPGVTGPYGTASSGPALATAAAYAPLAGSALIDEGSAVSGNGGVDFAGHTLYNKAPDVGAFEYSTPTGAPGEAIDGLITSSVGGPLSGVAVSVSAAGQTFTATSDATGFYVVPDVPFGADVTVTASTNYYKTVSKTVTVADGDSTRLDLVLTPTITTGTLQGIVDDDHGQPLSGATVALSRSGTTAATTKTDAKGGYSFKDVTAANGYTLTATKSGYRSATDTQVTVVIATTTTAATLLMPTTDGTVIQSHDFNTLPTGPLTTGTDDWNTSASGGSVDVIADAPGANRSLQETRSSNSGITGAELDFATPLAGLITVEADVQRTDSRDAYKADYFSAPYIYGSGSTPGVAVATTKGEIAAYEGTSLKNLVPYTPGTWYHLALVVDTVNQRYDFYVNGKEVVADAPFRGSMPGIQRIVYQATSSNYGTQTIDNVRVGYGLQVQQASAPAKAALSTTQGWATGLHDGYFDVHLNNWWGSNATSYALYQNGTLIYTEPLLANGDDPQASTVTIGGLPNGNYEYTGVLSNSAGDTSTSSVTVTVTDADPGTPVLSDNAYDGASDTTVTTNMWWGTNATSYTLYVDGAVADQQQLAAATPAAQKVTTELTGLAPGIHQVVAVLTNRFGFTSSQPLTLDVTG